jgi:hypothetical protein
MIRYKTKYGNVKVKHAGFLFDSRKEMRRYKDLLLLSAAGEIENLQVHPKFTLQESFRDRNNKKIQAITVTWDFYYTRGDQVYVEDVKSPATRKEAAYNIRKRLFILRYPHTNFIET